MRSVITDKSVYEKNIIGVTANTLMRNCDVT